MSAMMNEKYKNRIWNVLIIFLGVVSLFASFSKIITGFDIDEAYALAMPYRMLQGDRLFLDMWEVHQTSSFLPYIFIAPFVAITGSADHLVVYTRIVATIIHFALSLVVYIYGNKIQNHDNKKYYSAIFAMGYFSFLPKWIINIDFSMMQLWFFTLFLVGIYEALFGKKNRQNLWLFFAGIMLAFDVLSYPGMAILYIASVILLLMNKQVCMKERVFNALFLALGSAILAVLFFLYIFSNMSLAEFLNAIPKVFMDGAHQYDFSTKMSLYFNQWFEVLKQTLILGLPALAVTGVIRLIYKKIPFGCCFCIVFTFETSALISFAGLFTTWGPFRLQVRYIIQFALSFYLFYMAKKKHAVHGFVHWILYLSLAAFIGILVASNVGPTSSASYLVIGNILFAALLIKECDCYGSVAKNLSVFAVVLFTISLLMCKGFYMRNTEYVPGDISDELMKIQEGPLAGVYVRSVDGIRYKADYETIKENTTDNDLVLFMGTESLCNLYAKGTIVSPTTISTPAFNEQWRDYFEMHEDKMPTVIFLAKNTVDNREKFFTLNPFGIWIAENYDVNNREETDSLCIIRK